MLDIQAFASAVSFLTSSWGPWMVVLPGLAIGLIGGAIPGLSTSITMAIFLPFALYMDFLPAVLFLTSIFTGGGFGGAIPAILMNTPGTTSAVATTLDGYPMAREGKHNEALGIALSASCLGVIFGYTILLFLIDPISRLVLRLGPPEMFLIMFWGLTMIAVVGRGSTAKGLVAGAIGMLIGTVGMTPQGHTRGTLGLPELIDGVPLVPAMIGLLAVPELLRLLGSVYVTGGGESRGSMNFRLQLKGFSQAFQHPWVLLRGSVIGSLIGAVPGVGASVANLISYAEARRTSKDPEQFGHGAPVGVIAAESANSSSEGGSLGTLLTLGIPGGAGTAILLAALTMHNVTGGPRFIESKMDVVYMIILGNLAQGMILIPIGLGFIYLCSGIIRVPVRILVPVILALVIFGAYSITGSMTGPYTVAVFSIVGYAMLHFGYSLPAMVVGLLLGGMAEGELARAYQLTQGRWDLILSRPLSLLIFTLIVFAALSKPAKRSLQRRRARRKSGANITKEVR